MPNIVFKEKQIYDYVWTLWGNSTLGLLCYWLICGKQQAGRGRSSKAVLDSMSTLDVRQLSNETLANAGQIFNELKNEKMLPFNYMDEDPKRNECLKAFESCLKVICQKRGWSYSEKDTANRLIEIVFDHDLIDSHMKSHFTALGSTLKSGVPTVRNRLSGHGQGPKEITVPEYIVAYILHLTASNILLLAKADENKK